MSRLTEYRQLEQQLAAQLAELETLKNDSGLKKEIEFETKLRALLAEYGHRLKSVINLLDPQTGRRAQAAIVIKGTRKPRGIKVYKKPNTDEVIETKGGSHRQLKEWKSEFSADVVESWRTQ